MRPLIIGGHLSVAPLLHTLVAALPEVVLVDDRLERPPPERARVAIDPSVSDELYIRTYTLTSACASIEIPKQAWVDLRKLGRRGPKPNLPFYMGVPRRRKRK